MPLKKGKKKKKGGAKKKVNKAEKAKEKLEKACELMTSQTDLYQNFLDRMDRWIVANKHKAVELFKRFDRNGDGVLTYDEFKSGMLDLDAPCNALELHVLAKRLDKDKNETIDYVEFSKGLSFCTDKDLSRMEYMTLVIKESMRMMNAAPMISRTVTVPYNVNGVTIPAGSMVFLSIHQLHHNPSVWGHDQMEFKPSRFLPENLSQMDPFAYVPFSAGARNCIGQQFALNDMKVFLGRILRRFRLSLVDGEPEPGP